MPDPTTAAAAPATTTEQVAEPGLLDQIVECKDASAFPDTAAENAARTAKEFVAQFLEGDR